MASNFAVALLVIVISFMFGGSLASTVVVGGSEGWRYGYNYTDWSLKQGPFYINDTLVFKSATRRQPHSVYLLPNLYSYVQCDFRNARLLWNPSKVKGDSFSYVVTEWRPHYFASAGGNGADCKNGLMKFFAVPLPRWFN